MKKYCLLLAGILTAFAGRTANYYVNDATGNNANSGLTPALAKKTIQAASNLTNPGDTVFIMNGTYTNTGNVLTIARSGTAGAPIVYTNFPGSTPKLQASVTTYLVISIAKGNRYININGLEISGYGVNLTLAADSDAAKSAEVCPVAGSPATSSTFIVKYNGNGIVVDSSHHVTLSNNKVHDCTGAGIAIVKSDYITIDRNTVYNNSWYTIYGTSGISFNNSMNYDNNITTYRNIVTNNVCYNNRLYVPWRNECRISDGNGIILDIPLSDYNGKSLVANNICYNNGGSGIHTLEMDHTDIINNVSYLNSASFEIDGGGIYAYDADDVKFYNNIIVSRPGKRTNNSRLSTNLEHDYNIYFGGSSVEYVGTHSLIQDPKFVNASTDPAVADFHLQQGSFAINNGDNSHAYPVDFDGVSRPLASTVDIGAYESAYTGNLNTCTGNPTFRTLGSGAGTGEPGAGAYYGPYNTWLAVNNAKSRRVIMYPQQLLSGVPANSSLISLQFRRALQSGSTKTTTDHSVIRIYLRNEASDHFGAGAFNWSSIQPGAANPAVLVYGGEASTLVGNAGGWITVPFQVPFTFTGGNLGVFVEYLQKGSVSAAPDILWVYDNGGSQPLYNIATYPNQLYATKTATTSGNGVISNSLATNNERRPVMSLSYCATAFAPGTPSMVISTYPNPVSNRVQALLNISEAGTLATVSIRDLSGNIIISAKKQLMQGFNTIEMDASKLSGSTYLFVVELPGGKRLINKFVKM